MALLFIEGFDTYNNPSDLNVNGWTGGGYGNSPEPGRFNGQSWYSTYDFTPGPIGKTLGSNLTTIIAGVAFKTNYNNNAQIIRLNDSATVQIYLSQNYTDHCISVYNGSGTLLGSTPPNSAPWNTWNYVEVKTTISSTVGTVQINLNGVLLLSLTGINTQNSANSYVNNISLPFVSAPTYWDDLYVCDTTTGPGTYPNNNFLGDVRVDTLFPTGAGDVTNFATTGSSNWATVGTANPDSTTIYNYNSTIGAQDLFTVPTLGTGYNVYGTAVMTFAFKDNAELKQIASEIKSNATTHTLSTYTLSASGTYDYNLMPINPVSSASWTTTDINTLQIGYKIIT
jgi:hypothetical protein